MSKVIQETANGKVFRCNQCNKIHIEFKNLNFNFTKGEYDYFANYFKKLKGAHWEAMNCDSIYERKIIVPVGHKNINVLLNSEELEELRRLLVDPDKPCKNIPMIKIDHFNLDFVLN